LPGKRFPLKPFLTPPSSVVTGEAVDGPERELVVESQPPRLVVRRIPAKRPLLAYR
jgi:hypothetical protein